MEKYKNLEQNLDKSNEKLHISDVSCSVCKSCEREICPRCNSRLIKYKVVDVNGKSLNKNSYICTYCSFISDLDVKHYN
jgi:predicted metal-binding protein